MLAQAAERVYRTWILDSRRWQHYRPRPTDIVIATYPKCGTTWMQRIVGLLVFKTPEPRPIMEISPWIDRRFPEPVEVARGPDRGPGPPPLRQVASALRRPADLRGGQIHPRRAGRTRRLHVLPQSCHRPSRPRCWTRSTGPASTTTRSARPYPRCAADPARHFRQLARGGRRAGPPRTARRRCRSSTSSAAGGTSAQRANVLLVHYNDLKADLAGEMRRVADFLDISIPADVWPGLVGAAGFEAMRRDGAALMGKVAAIFQGGSRPLLPQGHERALARRVPRRRTSTSTMPRSRRHSHPHARGGWRTAGWLQGSATGIRRRPAGEAIPGSNGNEDLSLEGSATRHQSRGREAAGTRLTPVGPPLLHPRAMRSVAGRNRTCRGRSVR